MILEVSGRSKRRLVSAHGVCEALGGMGATREASQGSGGAPGPARRDASTGTSGDEGEGTERGPVRWEGTERVGPTKAQDRRAPAGGLHRPLRCRWGGWEAAVT